MTELLETDYLIIGAGVSGMSFADVLLTKTNKEIVIVDRRHAPGGHWNDAYPFARLHQPSAVYGVDSTPLGGFGADPEGDETLLERATASEVCAYYDRILHQRLLPSGRVRFMHSSTYLGDGMIKSGISGASMQVRYNKLVDATYLEGEIPATSPPPFQVAEGARCVPVGDLVRVNDHPSDYVVIGSGKTGQDACLWLLGAGVPPDSIRWVRSRDPWLLPRPAAQPGPGLSRTIEIHSKSIEVAARASSMDDLFKQLEEIGALTRIDPEVTPKAFVSSIISDWQLSQLRRIKTVIRLGHIQSIEKDEIVFDKGTVPTATNTLHIHCAASGVGFPPAKKIFENNLITPQSVRYGLVPYSVAIIAYVEATRADEDAKNALCEPLTYTGFPKDWVTGLLKDFQNARCWLGEPDLLAWMNETRLNMASGLFELRDQEAFRSSMSRIIENTEAAEKNLKALLITAN